MDGWRGRYVSRAGSLRLVGAKVNKAHQACHRHPAWSLFDGVDWSGLGGSVACRSYANGVCFVFFGLKARSCFGLYPSALHGASLLRATEGSEILETSSLHGEMLQCVRERLTRGLQLPSAIQVLPSRKSKQP